MASTLSDYTSQFGSALKKLTLKQKIGIGASVLISIAALILLITWANRPNYSVLFSNLEPADASKIVDKLKQQSVPYQIGDNGRAILVPKERVYELRLQMAGQGLPQSSVVGYEIFDKPSFGMTDFTEKLNYKRALEGELEKTILQLDEVEGARVHIVIPEKALFESEQKKTTASVFVKLKDGAQLSAGEIKGVQRLIASSVEGLEPNDVTIVDSKGNLLSKKTDELDALTAAQYDLQSRVESYLSTKAQTMLDAVLGPGNAIVRVSADLDFTHVEKTTEQYDPNTVILSEQTNQERTSVPGDTSIAASVHTNTVTNYDVGKSVERVIGTQGDVKKLAVAVLVNGKYTEIDKNGQKTIQYTPRSSDEMAQLTDIVKKAVGFDSQRGDEVSVVNIPFENTDQSFLLKHKQGFQFRDYVDKIIVVMAMLGAIIVFLSIFGKMKKKEFLAPQAAVVGHGKPATGRANETQPETGPQEIQAAEYTEEVLRQQKVKEDVSEYIQTNPVDAAKLLKVWLTEGED